MGQWGKMTSAQLSYLLTGLKPSTLLAMAFWEGAAEKEFDVFWHERFMPLVCGDLIHHLFPFLPTFEANIAKAQAAGKAVPAHVLAARQWLPYEAMVVVQDALELVDMSPENPAHKLLLQHNTFRWVAVSFPGQYQY